MSQEDHGLSKRLQIEGRRIAVQHERLHELWRQFTAAIEASSEMEVTRFTFRELHDGLIAHFDLEERIQIPALHGSNPDLQPQLTRLVEDHTRFRRQLEALARAVEGGAVGAIRTSASRLRSGIDEHEAREERLFPGAGRKGGFKAS